MGTPVDVVAIGEPLVEFNQTRGGEPTYLQGFGGDTSNMIIAAARHGARAAYVSRVGDDEFGRLFLSLWDAEGVDRSAVAMDAEAFTGVYFVTHGSQGHVFHYLRKGSAASRLRREELPLALIEGARFVHASGISLAISADCREAVLEAFHRARAAGARVSFDANLRVRLWPLERAREGMRKAIGLADFFFPSFEDAAALSGRETPQDVLAWAHGLGARNVLLKLGAQGVIVSDGSSATRIDGIKVQAVDATGAGDCFCGAALARLAAGDGLVEAARYANAAAALATTGYGAVAPIPRPPEVAALLRR
jgi:2-dehydro-3-deoxygluconokinase